MLLSCNDNAGKTHLILNKQIVLLFSSASIGLKILTFLGLAGIRIFEFAGRNPLSLLQYFI